MTNGEQRAPGVERTSLSGQEFTINKIDIRDRIRKNSGLGVSAGSRIASKTRNYAIRASLAAHHEHGPFSYATAFFRFQPPPLVHQQPERNIEGPMAFDFQFPSQKKSQSSKTAEKRPRTRSFLHALFCFPWRPAFEPCIGSRPLAASKALFPFGRKYHLQPWSPPQCVPPTGNASPLNRTLRFGLHH